MRARFFFSLQKYQSSLHLKEANEYWVHTHIELTRPPSIVHKENKNRVYIYIVTFFSRLSKTSFISSTLLRGAAPFSQKSSLYLPMQQCYKILALHTVPLNCSERNIKPSFFEIEIDYLWVFSFFLNTTIYEFIISEMNMFKTVHIEDTSHTKTDDRFEKFSLLRGPLLVKRKRATKLFTIIWSLIH